MGPHCAMHRCLFYCCLVTPCSLGLAQCLALAGTLWKFSNWMAKSMWRHAHNGCAPVTLEFSSPYATGFCFHFPTLWEESRTWSRTWDAGVRGGNGAQGQRDGSRGGGWVDGRKRHPLHLFQLKSWWACAFCPQSGKSCFYPLTSWWNTCVPWKLD